MDRMEFVFIDNDCDSDATPLSMTGVVNRLMGLVAPAPKPTQAYARTFVLYR